MHRTLKRETARPPARTLRAQQRALDRFRREYNEERPHEALAMATPGSLYAPAGRPFPERLPELEYPAGFTRRIVQERGDVRWRFGRMFLGEALAGETVGFEEIEHGWRIWLGPLPLALLDERQIREAKPRPGFARRGRLKAQFLDGSGRPTGSRRRPKTKMGKLAKTQPPHKDNP